MKSLGKYIGLGILIASLLASGCAGGTAGPPGPPGASNATGILKGVVTGSLTGKPVAGVQAVLDPAIPSVTVTTDAAGNYTASLPVGYYSVRFQKENYTAVTEKVSLLAGLTVTRNIVLPPVAPVVANAGKDQSSTPGGRVTLDAAAEVLDGSTSASYQWTQVSGAPASLDNPRNKTVQATLATAPVYKSGMLQLLEDVDRFEVQAINPHVLEGAETAVFQVTVTTSSGSYRDTVNVAVPLPYAVSPGIRNVPVGLPVLLRGKAQSGYSWVITAPAGSRAALDDSASRFPAFTPDFAGEYILTEKSSGATLRVYAGNWQGAISGIDDKGRPLAQGCTTCHNNAIAKDNFTAWKESGHAEIFTQNLNTSATYNEGCFSCHAVGFDKSVKNAGFDDAPDYAAFMAGGILGKPSPNNWRNMLSRFPEAAKMANIQCENCHGPNNHAALHPDTTPASARNSVSSDVCGVCHGEPPRHARFQQWEESTHANLELAVEEASVENRAATAGHCGRCHSAQGFLAWLEQGDLTKLIQGAKGNATVDELRAMGLTKDSVQPVTCTACHDPHNSGTVSGKPNNTTVRLQGNVPLLPAGFQARNVGRGAVCIVCHNTRNGTHNDAAPPTSYSAPHVAAQGDVLMGENAYFVRTRERSPHASITDSCVRCHMEVTPPPPELSYQLAGTNHAFKAGLKICSSCHSDVLDAEAFQTSYAEQTEELAARMGQYLMNRVPGQVSLADYTPHDFSGRSYDLKSTPVVVAKSNIASVEPFEPHGQQGFLFKFKTPVTFTYAPAGQPSHSVAVTQAEVQMGDITTDGKTAVIPVNDVLVKVGWNYFLIHGDASEGIHNPDFVDEVLGNSLEALFPTKVGEQPE